MSKLRLWAFLPFLIIFSSCARDQYVTLSGYAQGGTYFVKLNLRTDKGMCRERVARMQEKVDAILSDVDNCLSGYNANSTLSRFNAGERVEADSMFVDIYQRSRYLWEITAGAVDVACAPLFDLWGFGFKNNAFPDDRQVDSVKALCGMERLRSRMPVGTISPAELLTDGSAALPCLNYNAVAQGYSCDLIARYLHSLGIKDMLVNVGGEMYCEGHNPSGKCWTIGIDRPVDGNYVPGEHIEAVFPVKNLPCGVVTSGNYRKFYIHDGRKYSHTVDPRSGRPVSHNLLSATVIAPDATIADGLATFCMVVGLEEAKAFIEADETLEACLIYDEAGEMKHWSSKGFPSGE